MPTAITLVSANSVPSNYTWDDGTPFSTTSPLVCTVVLPINETITGYAPGVKVFVENNSSLTTTSPEFTALSSLYSWDFGDYYNHNNNNYVTSCSGQISHVYIMPGTYTITLTRFETGIEYDPILKTNNIVVQRDNPAILQNAITVIGDIPPIASIGVHNSTPATGTAPHTVRLTAKTTKSGSFPIDKIVWDFGDGSPLVTVSRYATATNNELLLNNIFVNDPADPRNYDPVHTYQRRYEEYAVFYPCITAYSSSTDNFDTCSTTVGPITLPTLSELKILKNKLAPTGTFYAIKVDDNITFVKSLTTITAPELQTPTNPRTPSSPIRNIYNPSTSYIGNTGTDYYSISVTC